MLNRAQLIGHVGKDPEIRATQSGAKVATFSVATTEKWKDKDTGEAKERTEWHRIVCWGDGLVGVIEKYVAKGQQLYIEGRISTREYEDGNGVKRWTTEVVVQGREGRVTLLGRKEGGARPPGPEVPPQGGVAAHSNGAHGYIGAGVDAEIPF